MGAAPDIRRGRKFDQVLAGARTVFMQDGFEGASVDDIARKAGVSKATLYAYFPDKRQLFLEVAKGECCRQAAEAEALVDDATAPEEALTIAATKMVEFFTSDFGMKVFRMCVAEADRFPELGREFYESGPAMARGVLVDFIRERVQRGQMVCDDYELAADQFAELCKADLFHRIVFGIRPTITEADRQRVIRGAVATFMARYGARS
jgi:TetR/AcrR family transcriptional regulator, mexJK operon transcriptional repressor